MTIELTLNTKVYYYDNDCLGKAVGFVLCPVHHCKKLVIQSEGNNLDSKGQLLALDTDLVSPRKCRYTSKGSIYYKYHEYKPLWEQLPEYEWKTEFVPHKVFVLQKVEKEQKDEHSN